MRVWWVASEGVREGESEREAVRPSGERTIFYTLPPPAGVHSQVLVAMARDTVPPHRQSGRSAGRVQAPAPGRGYRPSSHALPLTHLGV